MRSCVPERRRWLSTNHLMGAGYWVWLIPLGSGSTSVGIVADPALHPFHRLSRFDRALDWLREFGTVVGVELSPVGLRVGREHGRRMARSTVTKLPIAEARRRYLVNERARKFAGDPQFSVRIRQAD